MSAPGGVVRQSGGVDSVDLGPNRVRFALSAIETGGGYSLTHWTMAPPPAPGPPLHLHHDADEAVYVLDGLLECRVGDRSIAVASGGVALVPRGTWHTVANVGTSAAEFLVILTPPGFEQYWREAARLTAASGGSPDPDEMLALQRKYQMETGGRARQFAPEASGQ